MALSLAAIPLAGLLEVHSWVNAVPVRGAQDLISIAPTYECVFGELLAWLLAACLAAPPVAIPFTGASALRVTITVVSTQEFNTSGSFPLCSSPRSRFQLLASLHDQRACSPRMMKYKSDFRVSYVQFSWKYRVIYPVVSERHKLAAEGLKGVG